MQSDIGKVLGVSTHSRPKAAARTDQLVGFPPLFQHTAARRRLPSYVSKAKKDEGFQHTAARRRLLSMFDVAHTASLVSTHSRPKAAALFYKLLFLVTFCFNTQPPEGGCNHCANPLR